MAGVVGDAAPWLMARGPAVPPSRPCQCAYCRSGRTTAAHADVSHDQRSDQVFDIGSALLRIRGGTTKCARLALGYALAHPSAFERRRVLELGAGAGLLGLGLSVGLGCDVVMTDQAPVLELTEANVAANVDPARHRVRCEALQWGPGHEKRRGGHDLVVGADLHFAQENADALWQTLRALVGTGQRLILATIRRADWEQALFDRLDQHFVGTTLVAAGDVALHSYVPRT